VLEMIISQIGPAKWEWRVRDRDGTTLLNGLESTRWAAKHSGARALFLVLVLRSSTSYSDW
jgi:hypothetical protein